jgi:diguanylate cyclase (GGDEF)-like protein
MAGSQTDVTERRAAEQQLLHDAFHDHLTGLPNRALFLDRVGGVIGRTQRNPEHEFAVLFFDLDRFKVINDGLGHAVGDQVLVAVADRLSRCVRPGDTVARLGGDEFAVLLDGISGRDAATDFAERINTHLIRPFHIAGNEVFTSASIGIASSRTGYSRAEDMLRDADTAMYRAKHLGKARHQVFDTAMHARAMRQLLLENDLRRAMEREELALLYQPIVAMPSRRIRGFEALLRWHHPDWGEVPRQEFLPVAEETGLILPLGDWVLEQSCRQLSRWRASSPVAQDLTVSVNLSGRQIAQGDLIDRVTAALAASGLPVSSLRLEITESVLMEHLEPATAALRQLKELGVAVDIDDFGTGYSSLSYLHRFPIDRVKIDRSFVGSMLADPQSLEIVRAIVGLAQSLGMEAVAEGVEHEPEAAMLANLGCPLAQGYLLGMPMPPDEVAARLGLAGSP